VLGLVLGVSVVGGGVSLGPVLLGTDELGTVSEDIGEL